MSTEMCAACQAAWGDIESGCAERHNSTVLALAEKLAEAVGHHNPTLQQIGWFADDAESVVSELGQQDAWSIEFTFETVRSPDGHDPLIKINGVMFRCAESPMSLYVAEPAGEEGSS